MTPQARDRIERLLSATDGWPTPSEASLSALREAVRDCLRDMDEVLVERDEAKTAAWYAFVAGAKWWEYHSTKGTMWQSDVIKIEAEASARYPYAPHWQVRVAEIERDAARAELADAKAHAAEMDLRKGEALTSIWREHEQKSGDAPKP